MYDQAEKLRNIIKKLKKRQLVNADIQKTKKIKNTKIFTITSGKGGVGKSNITVNLAVALSDLGNRVIVIDADLGLANIDVLFGNVPKYTLMDVINDKKNILEVLSEDQKSKVKYLSGGSGVEELARLNKTQIDNFIKNIGLLDRLSDIILVDTGAGIADNVISFVMAADEVILVTTPEPTSMTDAYALIKIISKRDKKKAIRIIVNRVESELEANSIIDKLKKVANKFLAVDVEFLGYILNEDVIAKAVKQQQPFSIIYPKCEATKKIKQISMKLMNIESKSTNNNGIKTFVSRIVDFLSM